MYRFENYNSKEDTRSLRMVKLNVMLYMINYTEKYFQNISLESLRIMLMQQSMNFGYF